MKESKKELLIKFNKDNIIKTAKELFSVQGLEKTTMDEISRESGYSKSTVYVYFKSKDEIYNYIIFESMQHFKEVIEKSINESEGFKKRFFSICDSIVKFQEEYPNYFKDVIGQIDVSDKQMDEIPVLKDIFTIGEEINKYIIRFIKEGIEEKVVREDLELLPTVFSVWGSICGNIIMSYEKEQYISKAMNKTRKEFLDYSFNLIYKSVIK